MSYCLVANAFRDGLILYFSLSVVNRTAWVRLEGGLKGEKTEGFFLSPQSFPPFPYHFFLSQESELVSSKRTCCCREYFCCS